MDGNDCWSIGVPSYLAGEDHVDGGDWRATLQRETRERIVNDIMETIKRHLLFSDQEGIKELKKIAELFEEKIYNTAASQSDYWHEISSKMLTMESKSQNYIPISLPPNSAGIGDKHPDPEASPSIQPQGQSHPIPLPVNQPQAHQQFSSQLMQGIINSATLPSSLPPVSDTNQTPINVIGENANSMSNVAPNPIGSTSMAQGVPSNMFGNAQQLLMQFQLQLIQLQQQLLMQSQLQQQLQFQQGLMQTTELQPAKLPCMQASSNRQSISSPVSSFPQNQLSSVQHSIARQQQQQQFEQQTNHQNLLLHPLMAQQKNISGMHQQELVPQSNFSGLQQQMSPQQVLGTQSCNSNMLTNLSGNHQQQVAPQTNFSGLQQEMQQQQLLATQPCISNMLTNLSGSHQQQVVPQTNFSGLKQQMPQQQLLGTQSGNSSMQSNLSGNHQQQLAPQSNLSIVPRERLLQQLNQQQQRYMPRLGKQKHDMLQQQQQPLSGTMSGNSSLQSNLSASLDSTAQTGHANGGDWQEEVYQKIQTMKEMYLPELNEMQQKIDTKLQQQLMNSDKVEKLKMIKSKATLARMVAFLQVSKDNVLISLKEKLTAYENLIITVLNTNRPSKRMRLLPSSDMETLHLPGQQMPQQYQIDDDDYEVKPDISSLSNATGLVGT